MSHETRVIFSLVKIGIYPFTLISVHRRQGLDALKMDAVLQSIFRRHFKESGTLQRAMALA